MKIILKIIVFLILILIFVVFDRIRIPENQEEIAQIAQKVLEEKNIEPKNDLNVDGCTLWPDKFIGIDISKPCIEHDVYYWLGGTEEERLLADQKLKDSTNELVPYLGNIMYLGVRIGGDPNIPVGWRWGYGTSETTYRSELNQFITSIDSWLNPKTIKI